MKSSLSNKSGFFQKYTYSQELNRLDYDKELGVIDDVLSRDPNKAVAWYLKGTIFLQKKEINDALFCLNKAIEINPNEKIFLYKKTIALQLQGDYDAAIKSCNDAIGKDYVGAITKKIELLKIKLHKIYTNNNIDAALQCCNEILIIRPNDNDALSFKSYLLIILQRYISGIECLEMVLKNKPKDSVAWFSKAILHLILKQPDKALISINKAIEIDRENESMKSVMENIIFLNSTLDGVYTEFVNMLEKTLIMNLRMDMNA